MPKEVGTQFEHLELWAEVFIDEKRKLTDEKPTTREPIGTDQDGLPVWSIESLFDRFVRDKMSSYNRHQTRVDFSRAMSLFKHIIGRGTDARHLDQKSIDKFVDTR